MKFEKNEIWEKIGCADKFRKIKKIRSYDFGKNRTYENFKDTEELRIFEDIMFSRITGNPKILGVPNSETFMKIMQNDSDCNDHNHNSNDSDNAHNHFCMRNP